jgi:hypothetical protein
MGKNYVLMLNFLKDLKIWFKHELTVLKIFGLAPKSD